MTLQEFQNTSQIDNDWTILLQSLWYDKHGNWDKAHDLADSLLDQDAAWVHAYLHRKEGDKWNANYWYSRAGRSMPNMTLAEEWEYLAEYFIKKEQSF